MLGMDAQLYKDLRKSCLEQVPNLLLCAGCNTLCSRRSKLGCLSFVSFLRISSSNPCPQGMKVVKLITAFGCHHTAILIQYHLGF